MPAHNATASPHRREGMASDLFVGTLDILVLKAVSWAPRHGYAIGRWIRDTTEDVLAPHAGA